MRALLPLPAGLLLAWLLPVSAVAGTYPVFGPEELARTPGKPAEVSRTFTATRPGAGYQLRIENGQPRAGAAGGLTVKLNREPIVKPADFQAGVAVLERPVTLKARNTLEIKLAGAPVGGPNVRVSIVGIDDELPALTVTVSPAPNAAGWHAAPPTVRFACADAVSGIATCPPEVRVTTEGARQRIAGTAVDRAGNRRTAEVLVSLDRTPPSLAILTPATDLETNAATVEVTGSAADGLELAGVDLAGAPATLSGGAFRVTARLADGDNVLTATARDAAGNTATATTGVRIVRVALPEVAITSPEAHRLTAAATVEVRGRVGAGVTAVEVNGMAATLASGAFVADLVPLFEGTNTLTAVARDGRGRTATATVPVIRDSTPPRLAIDSPIEGGRTTTATVTVTGLVNDLIVGSLDRAEAQVTVQGAAAEVANRRFVARAVPLTLGENRLVVAATDLAGNAATAEVRVWREAAAGKPTLRRTGGNLQSGVVGAELPLPVEVELRDGAGRPLAGKPVLFRIGENNGALRAAAGASSATPGPAVLVSTDAAGRARAVWRLGTRAGAGNQRVTATVQGVAGLDDIAVFTASGTPGPGTALHLDAGNRQSGVVGQPLPYPLAVVATDAGHNRLAGVPVTFRVTAGGGAFAGAASLTVSTDVYGRALATFTLGPQAGRDDQEVVAEMPGQTGAPVVFTASGYLAGEPAATRVSGVVLDNTGQPLAGVTVAVAETDLATRTDDQGQFLVQPAPVGKVRLIVDGATAERQGTWPALEYELVTVPGQDNTLGMPIHLLPLDLGRGVFVDETRGGTITVAELPGFALEIAPGSATFPGGGRSGLVSVTAVPVDKVPMVPNFGQQPRLVVTIQPTGVRFAPAAALTVPNVDGLTPGEVTEMYSFDHDLGRFVSIGTGTVSADGSVIRSDPGVGVVEGGWHCAGGPAAAGSAEPVRVRLSPEGPLVARKGDTLAATGAGTPPLGGAYSWYSAGSPLALRSTQTGQTSSTATFQAASPGVTKLGVRFTCTETGASDQKEAVVTVIDASFRRVDLCGVDVRLEPENVFGSLTLTARSTGGITSSINSQLFGGDYRFRPEDGLRLDLDQNWEIELAWKVGNTTARVFKLMTGEPCVQIHNAPKKLCAGREWELTGTTREAARDLVWESSNPDVLSVTGHGETATIKAISIGESTVRALDPTTGSASEHRVEVITNEQFTGAGPSEYWLCGLLALPSLLLPLGDEANQVCIAAFAHSERANRWSESHFPGCDGSNTEVDALRHAYFSCLLHSDPKTSSWAGNILEFHENVPQNDCTYHEMDFNNNEIGYQNALAGRDCALAAEEALMTGRLQVLTSCNKQP